MPPRFYTLSPALAGIPRIDALMGGAVGFGLPLFPDRDAAMLGWGRRASRRWAARYAALRGTACLGLEDGFLRSIGLGKDYPPLSLVVDDLGIYLDASVPSRLEALVGAARLDDGEASRARNLVRLWRAGRLSKYNHTPEWSGPDPVPEQVVLVVDQTFGDDSIRYGLANERSFQTMLDAAIDENPGREIWLKVHPEVFAGRKRGHFESLTAGQRGRVRILGSDVHPPSLLERAETVYVVTSQMGFEALLWGARVRTFGMPFYAGWGLTGDDLRAPSRRRPANLEALVYAALVGYPRYLDPETGHRSEAERVRGDLARYRRGMQWPVPA